MSLRVSLPLLLCAWLLALPAGAATAEPPAQDARPGIVAERSQFDAFVRSRPTPEEFREAYPEVWLILPGDLVSRQFCSEYYYFIAELDAEGRISGGNLE